MRVICTAVVKDMDILQAIKKVLEENNVDYKTESVLITVNYPGYDPEVTCKLKTLFESLDSHTIHYLW